MQNSGKEFHRWVREPELRVEEADDAMKPLQMFNKHEQAMRGMAQVAENYQKSGGSAQNEVKAAFIVADDAHAINLSQEYVASLYDKITKMDNQKLKELASLNDMLSVVSNENENIVHSQIISQSDKRLLQLQDANSLQTTKSDFGKAVNQGREVHFAEIDSNSRNQSVNLSQKALPNRQIDYKIGDTDKANNEASQNYYSFRDHQNSTTINTIGEADFIQSHHTQLIKDLKSSMHTQKLNTKIEEHFQGKHKIFGRKSAKKSANYYNSHSPNADYDLHIHSKRLNAKQYHEHTYFQKQLSQTQLPQSKQLLDHLEKNPDLAQIFTDKVKKLDRHCVNHLDLVADELQKTIEQSGSLPPNLQNVDRNRSSYLEAVKVLAQPVEQQQTLNQQQGNEQQLNGQTIKQLDQRLAGYPQDYLSPTFDATALASAKIESDRVAALIKSKQLYKSNLHSGCIPKLQDNERPVLPKNLEDPGNRIYLQEIASLDRNSNLQQMLRSNQKTAQKSENQQCTSCALRQQFDEMDDIYQFKQQSAVIQNNQQSLFNSQCERCQEAVKIVLQKQALLQNTNSSAQQFTKIKNDQQKQPIIANKIIQKDAAVECNIEDEKKQLTPLHPPKKEKSKQNAVDQQANKIEQIKLSAEENIIKQQPKLEDNINSQNQLNSSNHKPLSKKYDQHLQQLVQEEIRRSGSHWKKLVQQEGFI